MRIPFMPTSSSREPFHLLPCPPPPYRFLPRFLASLDGADMFADEPPRGPSSSETDDPAAGTAPEPLLISADSHLKNSQPFWIRPPPPPDRRTGQQ
ncbi:hypothetical protein EYF80_063272 [Liparis tanakae]|uniref:Uncharacterized protein n=1 Tax=Liparis tanakae TaxID=230148 RepID=A0A4Z2ECZ5_9TELE|nr:hypothetical protein EYF80_063272 [Liparis tanakae]